MPHNAHSAREKTPDGVEISDLWINPSGSGLLAKAAVTIRAWSGTTLHDCSVVKTKNAGFFVFPPQLPMIRRDGQVPKDKSGKAKHKPAISFTKEAGRRFSEAVVRLLRQSNPELFGRL
jgi:hypothetical protein